MAKAHYLQPVVDAVHFLYDAPNPALSLILRGDQMNAIVSDYTAKVLSVYTAKITPRSRSGELLSNVSADIYIGGRRTDRWVGEITSAAEYAMADEFGRHESNPYQGSHDLTESLYSVLPQRI